MNHAFDPERQDEHYDGVRFMCEVRDRPQVYPMREFFVNADPAGHLVPLILELPEGLSERAELRIVLHQRRWRNGDSGYVFWPGFEFEE